MQLLTPFWTSNQHCTLINRTSANTSIFPLLTILVMLVRWWYMQSLQGMRWQVLALADLPICRSAETGMLPRVAANQLSRWLKEFSDCTINSSRRQFTMFSSRLHWLLWGHAITGCIQVEWFLWLILLHIISLCLGGTSGQEKQKSCWDNEIQHCMHHSAHESCFRYCTYIVVHLLNQTVVGPWSLQLSRPTDNAWYLSRLE